MTSVAVDGTGRVERARRILRRIRDDYLYDLGKWKGEISV